MRDLPLARKSRYTPEQIVACMTAILAIYIRWSRGKHLQYAINLHRDLRETSINSELSDLDKLHRMLHALTLAIDYLSLKNSYVLLTLLTYLMADTLDFQIDTNFKSHMQTRTWPGVKKEMYYTGNRFRNRVIAYLALALFCGLLAANPVTEALLLLQVCSSTLALFTPLGEFSAWLAYSTHTDPPKNQVVEHHQESIVKQEGTAETPPQHPNAMSDFFHKMSSTPGSLDEAAMEFTEKNSPYTMLT